MRFLESVVSVCALTLVVSATAQQRDESEVVFVGTTDPDMVVAIKQARATLPDFLKLAANPPSGTEGYKLKVMVIDGDKTEHFWVTPFKALAEGFAGAIANDPKFVRNVKSGQIVQFDESLISDWGYTRDGRQVGSFTVCVLFKKMPADQAEYYRKNYGFDCR
ncbi:YegJ family protein [Variovorax ureilyticus]|uniref:YegJ family protein n=1 Tax=Variovorax ureilyticus TaxID=1836198 RepID=UPI003D666DD2